MSSNNPNRDFGDGRYEDAESSEITNKKDKRHSLASHVRARFVRFIRLSAILQRISEATGIPRDRLIRGGRSTHQDTSERDGRDIHAAHIIQAQLDPALREIIGQQMYDELQKLLEHTQSQPATNNNSRLGRAIDRAQREAINGDLNSIDFSLRSNNSNNIRIVRKILNSFLDRLKTARETEKMGKRRPDRLNDLSEAINTLQQVDIRDTLARAQGVYEYDTTIAEDDADCDDETDGESDEQNQSTGESDEQNQSTGESDGQNQSTSRSNEEHQSSGAHSYTSRPSRGEFTFDPIGNIFRNPFGSPFGIPDGNEPPMSKALLLLGGAAIVGCMLTTGVKPPIKPVGPCSIM